MAPAASAQTPEMRAVEGNWVGHISFRGTTNRTDQTFRGGFEFMSAGGEVEGTFQWGGGITQIGGVVEGPDTMPRFGLTSVVSNGVNIPDVSGGGEILFTAATCERLEGTGVNIGVERMGADISEIVWWAVRDGATSEPAAFFEAFEALQVKIGDLIKSLESGAVIVDGVGGQLEPLLAEAETLAARLGRTDGCGLEFYRSVIAAEVSRLIDAILANPDVGVYNLGQILLTAVRVGLIGGEAANPEVELAAHEVLAQRIQAAIEAEDFTELEILSLIAEDLGWDDLLYEAIYALIRIAS